MRAKTALKHAGARLLTALGAPRIARWARRDALLVLTYHNIVPSRGEAMRGEASLHTDRASFAEQLDLLAETHEVVSLADLLNGCRWRGDRPRALITFDDAYHGAMTIGLDELVKRHMVATVFVTPGFTAGRMFWWDALAGAAGGVLPERVRSHALDHLHGRDELVRDWAAHEGIPSAEPDVTQRCATLPELRAASRLPGLTFAAHSWSHPVLATLPADELRQELEWPLQWLRSSLGNVLPALAVPYGASSRWVEFEAHRLGYAVVFPGVRGWVQARSALPFVLPRQNVPAGLPTDTFVLRASGVLA